MTAPNSGTTTFACNSVGQLASVQNARDERTTFSYDLAGQQTLREMANGTRASQTFDSAGQLQQLHNLKSDDTVIAGFEYGYDAGGNRTHVLESNGDRVTWGYDAANQLTSEDRSGANAYAHSFGYDPVGNRLTKTEDGATTASSYDAANQIESSVDGSGTTNYTFDDNGNQHLVVTPAGDRTTWTWDYENQAVKVEPPTGTAEEMTYNADSRRVTLVGDSTQKFLRDTTSDNVVEEADENDSPIAIYTDGPDLYGSVISQERGNDIHFYHFNGQGSTVALTDHSELITDTPRTPPSANCSPRRVPPRTPGDTRGYKGGLGYYSGGADGIYVRARYLQPSLGRWLSMDPLGFVDGVNMFQYCHNTPNDPAGLQSLGTILGPINDWIDRWLPLPTITPPENMKRPDDIFLLPGTRTDEYNCHGLALGIYGHVDCNYPPALPPGAEPVYPQNGIVTLDLWYLEVLSRFGYKKSNNCTFECGKRKIAYFGFGARPVSYGPRDNRRKARFRVTHSAIQVECCVWLSKLGDQELAIHEKVDSIEDAVGRLYGGVLGCLEKPDPQMWCGCDMKVQLPFFGQR